MITEDDDRAPAPTRRLTSRQRREVSAGALFALCLLGIAGTVFAAYGAAPGLITTLGFTAVVCVAVFSDL